MRGRLTILILVICTSVFLHFYNGNRVVNATKELSRLEKTYNAEKNINTEQMVELDDLRSGRHIASLVRVELSNFIAEQPAGSVVYVHEPSPNQEKGSYCIIDLLASRAEAKNVEVVLD